MAALVALGPILVMAGIGIGIFAIGEDSPGLVLVGFVVATLGMLITIAAFIALRMQATRRKNPDDSRSSST